MTPSRLALLLLLVGPLAGPLIVDLLLVEVIMSGEDSSSSHPESYNANSSTVSIVLLLLACLPSMLALWVLRFSTAVSMHQSVENHNDISNNDNPNNNNNIKNNSKDNSNNNNGNTGVASNGSSAYLANMHSNGVQQSNDPPNLTEHETLLAKQLLDALANDASFQPDHVSMALLMVNAVRFLRARNWNLHKAEELWRNAVHWRISFKMSERRLRLKRLLGRDAAHDFCHKHWMMW